MRKVFFPNLNEIVKYSEDVVMKKVKEWYFAPVQGGGEEGFNDSGIAFFEDNPYYSTARETIQNALDAKDPQKTGEPVVVEFNHFKINTEIIIPDLDDFKNIIEENIESNLNENDARKFFNNAKKIISKRYINVLKVSDAATVGIEKVNKNNGRWHNLIKKKGSSEQQGNIGGTFGIGKSAPFSASKLRTILYNTKNIENEFGYIWKSIFTTHGKPKKRAEGYYCKVYEDENKEIHTDGFIGKENIPEFIDRKHYGSDLYIIGFDPDENEKPWNVVFQKSIIDNYFIAIYDNELKVRFIDSTRKDLDINYEISSTNIIERMKKDFKDNPSISKFPYLDAYVNEESTKFEENIEHLGLCELFVILKKDYNRNVAYMRSPKMLVEEKRNITLNENYNALFICTTKKGNKFLSKLEGPTHSQWKPRFHTDKQKASSTLYRIIRFINSSLREMNTITFTTESILGGLNHLTFEDDSEFEKNKTSNENLESKEDSFNLSSIETPWEDIHYKSPKVKTKRKRKRKIEVENGSDAGDEAEAGIGGSGENTNQGGDQPGIKGFGEMEGKKDGDYKYKLLPKSFYKFRCFQESDSKSFKLIISTKIEKKCSIKLYAQGIDNAKNESIVISNAFDTNLQKQIEVFGNTLSNVVTTPDPKTIELNFKHDRRYAVEVELYG